MSEVKEVHNFKDEALFALEMVVNVFDKSVPPSAVLFSPTHGMVHLIFTEMENTTQKYEIALSVIYVAALIGDVEAILFMSEAWAIQFDNNKDKALLDSLDNDPQKINAYLRNKYESFEECPFRKEMMMCAVDDGAFHYGVNVEIERDADKNLVWVAPTDDNFSTPMKSTNDFNQNFGCLLAKSNEFKKALEITENIATDLLNVDKVKAHEMMLKRFAEHIGYQGVNTRKISYKMNRTLEKIKLEVAQGNKKHTIH